MKQAVTIVIGLVCLSIGLALGYVSKEIYEKQRPKAQKKESKWMDELRTYQEGDFLHSYPGIKNHLSSSEQFLGDRLVECIEKKQSQENDVIELRQIVQEQETKLGDASFMKSFLNQGDSQDRPSVEGVFVPQYNRELETPEPLVVSDARYAQLFPNHPLQHPDEDGFGFVTESVDDVQAFLDRRVCTKPGFTTVDPQRRLRSKFFNQLRSTMFEGDLKIDSQQADQGRIRGRIEFQSPRHGGKDWIYIQQGALVMETRLIDPRRDSSVWRYSSCQPSVVLLNDRCSWSDQYAYEYKDFYFLAAEDLLVANVYCKKTGAQPWKRMGTLQFEQVGG